MDKEQQDRLWDELSESRRTHLKSMFVNDQNGNDEYTNGYLGALIDMFGEHNLNPKQIKTWDDVEKEMDYYFSDEMMEKEKAIHKILLIAKFLNGDWKPDWSDEEEDKYYFGIDNFDNKNLVIKKAWVVQYEIVYFRTEELAKQAVEILGEDTVRLALTTEY